MLAPAIEEVQALAGNPVELILATVDGTAQATVVELAETLSDVLHVSLNFV